MTPTEIRATLTARGLRPLKQLGQNFLHDRNLAQWLAERALLGVADGAPVVEIGPGLGALTAWLLRRPVRLTALEKDRGLAVFLRERFRAETEAGRFELREGDALALLPALGFAPAVICGNLPYYISTPLLMECLRLPGAATLFFVLQKEVAERLASAPGGKVYGALSVLIQTAYRVEVEKVLPGSVFHPPPEVDSAAVRLTPLSEPPVSPSERAAFAACVQQGFSQRRKKLSNLLPTSDGRRAEHLSPEEWVTLWRACREKEIRTL